ncbi:MULTISPECIES: hypothetical protein [Halorussus]|uniref:hypothetical protein n=1 Tax=Halorussus TaxID=1070314 RepID=UPI00209EEEC0|nr:hypothetical protein [Halorussus vallis]USZ77424.1 hypothetical protein NGM07_08850 [Halorussus vallis]
MNPRGETPAWQRRLKRKLGENPARFLDHDLVEHGSGHTDHTLQRLVFARIRGIDRLEVVNAWIAVERKLDRGPRSRVIDLLEERRAYLEEYGERDLPNLSAEERRERALSLYKQSPKSDTESGEEALSAAQKLQRMRSERGETA